MPRIDLNGAGVAYAEAGSGEPVLLLHGTANSGAQWRGLADRLQPGCHVLAPDLYGHGETDPWPGYGPLALADEAALAEAILPSGCGPIHLVGHSYGAAVALRFAVQWPERLRSLVLIEPVAFHLLRDDAADRPLFREIVEIADLVAKGAASGEYRYAMARFVDYWNGVGAWVQARPDQQKGLACLIPNVALDFWATMSETTPRIAYRRIEAPALVLRGDRSPQPAQRLAELVAESLPAACLETIAGAGHMLPLTYKEAVNAAIVEHLARNMTGRHRPAAA